MTTVRAGAPPPPPPPPPTPHPAAGTPLGGTRAGRGRELAARLREAASGTPGTLRLLGGGAVIVLVVFGVLGAMSVDRRDDALGDARAEAAQLVRFQTIRTNLVQADALATNAFLVGGLEPSDQRARYEQSIAAATSALTEAAANSHRGDADALRSVGQSVVRYAGLVESARANNRQGFPVGAAYLRQASQQLRTEVLPVLTELSDITQSRVKDAYRDSRSATDLLATGAFVAIVVLVVLQGYLTVRTRRLVSVPVLISLAIVVGATIVAGAVLTWSQSRANDVRDGDYRSTVALAQARIFAFDAKSSESLTLILRGSGDAVEQQFRSLADATVATMRSGGLAGDLTATFDDYLAVHERVRSADDGGDWDEAVRLATRTDIDDGSNATFQRFADATSDELQQTSAGIADDLDDARLPFGALKVFLVLAGIAAAVAAWQGVSVRLKEYR
jgi:hypothetical protein